MPCPVKELGVIEPFVAVDDSRTRMVAHGAMMARGCLWGDRARHAVPLLGKCVMRKERCGDDCLSSAIELRRFVGTGTIACATELLTQHLDCDA
jgi:hypothetical protein